MAEKSLKSPKIGYFVDYAQIIAQYFYDMPQKIFGGHFTQIHTAIRLSREISANRSGYVNKTFTGTVF